MLCFGLFLWKATLELNVPAEPAVSAAEDDFRPVVGDPPYRVAVDAGHGGSDPGAKGSGRRKTGHRSHGCCAAPMVRRGFELHPAANPGKL